MNRPERPPFPLHLFNAAQTRVWIANPALRAEIASCVAKRYPQTGAGILGELGALIAIVEPTGRFRMLQPPFKRYEFNQIANAPSDEACACHNFVDLEFGTWGSRLAHEVKRKGEHHPLCQFNPSCSPVFRRASESAASRMGQNVELQKRPDEWLKMQDDERKS